MCTLENQTLEPPKNEVWKIMFLFKWVIFRFHVTLYIQTHVEEIFLRQGLKRGSQLTPILTFGHRMFRVKFQGFCEIFGSVKYCWWNKSCTSWWVVYPIIYRVLAILAPSQVVVWDFFHQQYLRGSRIIRLGGFQIFVMFTPTWGRFPFWLIFFKGFETNNWQGIAGYFIPHVVKPYLPTCFSNRLVHLPAMQDAGDLMLALDAAETCLKGHQLEDTGVKLKLILFAWILFCCLGWWFTFYHKF